MPIGPSLVEFERLFWTGCHGVDRRIQSGRTCVFNVGTTGSSLGTYVVPSSCGANVTNQATIFGIRAFWCVFVWAEATKESGQWRYHTCVARGWVVISPLSR